MLYNITCSFLFYNIRWHMLYNITWHILYNITRLIVYNITWHMLYNIWCYITCVRGMTHILLYKITCSVLFCCVRTSSLADIAALFFLLIQSLNVNWITGAQINPIWQMLYKITWHMLYNITWHMLCYIT